MSTQINLYNPQNNPEPNGATPSSPTEVTKPSTPLRKESSLRYCRDPVFTKELERQRSSKSESEALPDDHYKEPPNGQLGKICNFHSFLVDLFVTVNCHLRNWI